MKLVRHRHIIKSFYRNMSHSMIADVKYYVLQSSNVCNVVKATCGLLVNICSSFATNKMKIYGYLSNRIIFEKTTDVDYISQAYLKYKKGCEVKR